MLPSRKDCNTTGKATLVRSRSPCLIGVLMLVSILSIAMMAPRSFAQGTEKDDLMKRHKRLGEEFERSEREAVDVDVLLRDLNTHIDELDSLRADTLAVQAVSWTQSLYTRRGELPEARDVIDRGIEIARRSGLRQAESSLTMSSAVTWAIAGNFESFIKELGELIPVFDELGDRRSVGLCWFNMGVAYTKLGRFPEALAAIQKAMATAQRMNDRPRLGSAYAMATELNFNAGRLAEATVLADSAVTITREVGRAVPLGAALTIQAHVHEANGHIDRALAAVDEAIAVREKVGDEVYVKMSRLQKALLLLRAGKPEECGTMVDAMLPALEEQGDMMQVHAALELKCQALYDRGLFHDAEQQLAQTIERFESDRETLTELQSQAGFFDTGGEYYATLARCFLREGDIESAWASIERSRGVLLTSSAAGQSAAGARTVSLEGLQLELDRTKAALIEFNDPRMNPLLAFVVTGSSIDAIELDYAPELVSDARATLDLMASGEDDDACKPALQRIARAVQIGKLASLPADIERVHIVPPSTLAGFPLEVLPLDSIGYALGDRFAVSYVNSASRVLQPAPRPTLTTILAFADPVLATTAEEPVRSQLRELAHTPLPRARDEIRVLKGPDTRNYTGADATKARLVDSVLDNVAVLHFATHALVNGYAPQESCLLLAGEDGQLTAGEVASMRLHADMVTLSGCQTTGGYTYLGEGTFGLTRAFLTAGARSVVASLWRVEDDATAHFMTEFYDLLREGYPMDVSLQMTRRAMKNSGYPYRDRSAFILSGAGAAPVPALAALGSRSGKGVLRNVTSLAAIVLALLTIVIVAGRLRRRRE